jgi:hypothetical protein
MHPSVQRVQQRRQPRPVGRAIGLLLLAWATAAAADATYRIDPPPATGLERVGGWPDLLERAGVAPAIAAIRARLLAGQAEAARQLALAEVQRLPPTTPEGRDALLALAEVEAAMGEPAARERYQRLIEAAQVAGGLLDPHLLAALRGQAFLALAFEDYPAADEALNSALQLHRRHYGLFDLGQTDYLVALIRLQILAGDKAGADQLQRRRLQIATRHYAADDPRLIEVYDEVAENYRQLVLPAEMYEAHRRKRQLLQSLWGEDDARLIPSLLDEARSGLLAARMSETEVPWDTSPLRRAQTLAAALDAAEHPLERANALIGIGDLYWLSQDSRQALSYYRQAVDSAAAVAERLRRPEVILWPGFEPLPGAAESAGRLTLAFTVTARGRAVGIRTATLAPADDANGLKRAEVWQRVIAQTYFRPALVDLRPRPARGVELQDRFRPAS